MRVVTLVVARPARAVVGRGRVHWWHHPRRAAGDMQLVCLLVPLFCFFFPLPRVRAERRLPVRVSNRLPLHALVVLSTADRLDYHQPISPSPPLRPWQQQHRFRSLAPRCTAFCFPPGRRKESGARAQRCGRTSISDPRGGALCYVVPPAWLTRRGATDSVAATILSPLPWSLQNWRAYLCALLTLSEGGGGGGRDRRQCRRFPGEDKHQSADTHRLPV